LRRRSKVILEPARFCPDRCFLNSHIGHAPALGSGWISWAEEPESYSGPAIEAFSEQAPCLENLNKFLGEPPSPSCKVVFIEEKMSQQEIQSTTRRGISTRSVVLVILLVGLGAGAVGYGLNNAFGATKPNTTKRNTNGQQWAGLKDRLAGTTTAAPR